MEMLPQEVSSIRHCLLFYHLCQLIPFWGMQFLLKSVCHSLVEISGFLAQDNVVPDKRKMKINLYNNCIQIIIPFKWDYQ